MQYRKNGVYFHNTVVRLPVNLMFNRDRRNINNLGYM